MKDNIARTYGLDLATQGRRMSWFSAASIISVCALSIQDCRQVADGLSYDFEKFGDYSTKGCYCVSAGQYAETCWYGTVNNGQQVTQESQLNCPQSDQSQWRPYLCHSGCGANTKETTLPIHLTLIPGQDALSLEVRLYDDTGSLVRGTDDVIEVRICNTSGVCSTKNGIVPSSYIGFNPASGIAQVEARVECPTGNDTAVFEAVLV